MPLTLCRFEGVFNSLDVFTVRYGRRALADCLAGLYIRYPVQQALSLRLLLGQAHPSLFGCVHCRGILPFRAVGRAGSTAAERVGASTATATLTRGAPQICRRGSAL